VEEKLIFYVVYVQQMFRFKSKLDWEKYQQWFLFSANFWAGYR